MDHWKTVCRLFNRILYSLYSPFKRGKGKGEKASIMGKKKNQTCEKFTCKGNRCSYSVTDVQSTYLLQDCCNTRLILNETFGILRNFVSHYPQRKIYLIIQILISPQCSKGNLKLQGPHLKAVTTSSWLEFLRHLAASLRYMKQFWFGRFFSV